MQTSFGITRRELTFLLSITLGSGFALAYSGNSVAADWGTYAKPFAADSLWNSRPVNPVLGEFVIPRSEYVPAVASGAYSTGVFLSGTDDGAVTVTGLPNSKGLWDPDAETHHDVTIPRWPENVVPATGNDGHADIVDPIDGILHSFYKLKFQDGKWMASQYAWSELDGRGWGDPAHYFQGSRAAGVPTSAGLIRKHEIDDGASLYRHALAMSLTFNALSPDPAYVFPATSADAGAASSNTGSIPEGALMMLPESFDTGSIGNSALRKVAETLKVYGAYVVDRNHGTPFVIYVENGSDFNLHAGGWNPKVVNDLDRIRASLRQVVDADEWLDGKGRTLVTDKNLNRLSMRGPWQPQSGTSLGEYDTWRQAVVFRAMQERTVQVNYSNRVISSVHWAAPVVGKTYRLTASTTGNGMLRLRLYDKSTKKYVYDSGDLKNGESDQFVWPAEKFASVLYATSGAGEASSVSGELVQIGD